MMRGKWPGRSEALHPWIGRLGLEDSPLHIVPSICIFSALYDKIKVYFGPSYFGTAIIMVKSRTVCVIEDQGPLVHLKYKALTALISLSCGLLGQFSYDQEDLFTTPMGL
jgi:hypothetical protein